MERLGDLAKISLADRVCLWPNNQTLNGNSHQAREGLHHLPQV